MKHLPNILTVLRFPLSFTSIILTLINTQESLIYALIAFMLAAMTDFADGYLARKKNLVSSFGKFWDPIADKVMIIGALLGFAIVGFIGYWVPIVVAIRGIGISLIRIFFLSKGKVLSAQLFGKLKTISQSGCVFYIFNGQIMALAFPDSSAVVFFNTYIVTVWVWLMVTLTLSSGLHYLWMYYY